MEKKYSEMCLKMMDCTKEEKEKYEKECRNLVKHNFQNNLYKYGYFDDNNYWKEILLGEVFFQYPCEWNDLFDSACVFEYETYKKDVENLFKKNKIKCNTDLLIDAIISKTGSCKSFNLNEFINSNIQIDDEVSKAVDALVEKIKFCYIFTHTLKASCFCEEFDNMKMWYYYSKKYTGFCVDFDFSKQSDGNIKPVVYTDKRFAAKNNSYPFFQTEVFLPMLLKNTCWRDEKEWRFIYPLELKDEKQTLAGCPVKSIYFGNKTSETNIKLALDLLKSKGDKLPKIYKMVANQYTNKFVPEEIKVL